jgi:transcriptional regulator with XRE-family HTH domain
MISGAQIRAARNLMGWTARDLSQRAVVSVSTVNLIENAKGLPSTTREQVAAVRAALEEAGIEFLDGDAPGVRLHPKGSKRKR